MTQPTSPRPDLLGPLLARLRQARGRSQQHLAAELCAASGVPTLSRHEVSRWERQRRVPGDFWLGWLAVVLAVPVELLAEAAGRSRPAHRATASTLRTTTPTRPAPRRAGGGTAPPRAGGTTAPRRAGGTTARPRPRPTGTAGPRPTGTAGPRPTGTAWPRPTGSGGRATGAASRAGDHRARPGVDPRHGGRTSPGVPRPLMRRCPVRPASVEA